MGISLWIVPPNEEAKLLKSIMSIRPSEPEPRPTLSEASYPTFHPHITLATFPSEKLSPPSQTAGPQAANDLPVGLDNIKAILSSRLSEWPKVDIKFHSVSMSDHYFRSVFLKIKNTSQLQALHAMVHNTLEIEPKTPLFPHHSLVYITSEDEEKHNEREMYLKELIKQGRVKGLVKNGPKSEVAGDYEEGGVSVDGSSDGSKWINGFESGEIWLVACDGPCESWRVLAEVQLAG